MLNSFYEDSLEDMPSVDWLEIVATENSQSSNVALSFQDYYKSVLRQKEDVSSGLLRSKMNTEECVDIDHLLVNNSDELSFNLNKIELPSDIGIQDTTTVHYPYNYNIGNDKCNIRRNHTRRADDTSDLLLSSVNMENRNDSSVDDININEFIVSSNGLLDLVDNSAVNNLAFNNLVFNDVLISDLNEDASITGSVVFDTPASSRSPINISNSTTGIDAQLKLDFQKVHFLQDELNTPDIINSIIENEKIDFSVSNGHDCKEVLAPSTIDETQLSLEETKPCVFDLLPSSPRRGKKRNFDSDYDYEDDDGDEDYVPPKASKFSIKKNLPVVKTGKRGRPPKRTKSVSSDDYSQLDPGEAKYREMRDKNNEASRRSRYKRKQNEMHMTQELSELESENIRLKVQVEELQKTVDSYRENLMKVMLNKK